MHTTGDSQDSTSLPPSSSLNLCPSFDCW
ncbi:hypothetical protein PSHT_09874 [Puccinia striiformis]|uniref:Uncharacterized protein n=1 Tax=Puccinia striiformis TaxID=27350 RepID=A0A2S4VDR4_9BASI|nr:hypothetical protein PSHT_09874 [Puccinia striiformis]